MIDEEGLFRTLFSAYHDALIVVDPAGAIVRANPSAAALLGYSVEELQGLHVDALVPDAVRPRHAEFRATYGDKPRSRPMGAQTELVARRKDGSTVQVEIALSPLDSHGLPLVIAAIRDIGAYPRVKQALRRLGYSERLARLGRLSVDVGDSQVLLDGVPVVAAEALGVDMATVYLLESNLRELRVASTVHPLHGEARGDRLVCRADSSLGTVLSQGGPLTSSDYRSETRFAVPQAYLDAGLRSALAVPISDRGRTIGVLVVRSRAVRDYQPDEVAFMASLANLLASALQRARSEEALEHAQRLESVGQLTGGIAHDFNNLLTVIQGNLQLLEDLPALAGDGLGHQLVDAASRAARRGAELTGKLLAFSRRQVLQPEAVDVGALLGSLADMLQRTLDQRIRISVAVDPSCSAARADPVQLEASLLNLGINARDAMPDGGTLRFGATLVEQLPAEIPTDPDERPVRSPGYVAITVADSGHGMPEDVRSRAFEPFFTTKPPGRGTGLGLSTVYGFVKQSRGAVTLDSTPGNGTTITLYIPVFHGAPEAPRDAHGAAGRIPEGLAVLLVEDDPEVSAVTGRFLEAMGFLVTAAPNAEQALVLLDKGEQFELLVSDIALGCGMRGTELAAAVQARLPAVKVLLMSGFSAELLDADEHAPAEWELLPKPFTRDELGAAAARVLAGT